MKAIKSALISVFYKDGLEPLVKKLHQLGVTIYSTGGTQSFIESFGIPVIAVEDLTSYPSILGGRVKTLHPKVFGGILGRRENEGDLMQLEEYQIPQIDLVVVDLYPFEETVASGAPEQDIIEKIDIGGISLIRAAAKNFKDVTIVSSKSDYPVLLELLNNNNGALSLQQRKAFAARAFAVSSGYDASILNYFSGGASDIFYKSFAPAHPLRYGENPHQKGTFYGDLKGLFEQLNGKELSYNNLLDVDAAVNLISEFTTTTVAILKHNNACGCASSGNLLDAWNKALAGDPVSAFGGVIITNATVDEATATEMNKLFFEIVVAPDYSAGALQLLSQKKNRIILKKRPLSFSPAVFRSLLNGVIQQDRDTRIVSESDLKPVTKARATDAQVADLIFANKLVKNSKSNAIILARDGQLLGSGVGHTSRVDALRHAIAKAKEFGHDLKGAVMSSDAFFPFPDCVEIASKAGIAAVIQPGGSVKDQDSIDYCNANGMAMVMTGFRHFKH